jgi:hypothetical protein
MTDLSNRCTMGKAAIALIAGWFSVGAATIGWILVHGTNL